MDNRKVIYLDDAIDALTDYFSFINPIAFVDILSALPPAEPEIAKEYDLKKIYNIYVKIAQAHYVYQPSKPKAITAMPFDWIEVQNLLEKYLEDHGADFDALCREYVSENVKDDHVSPAQPEIIRCRECKHYDGRPCGIVDWYNTADDFCSRAERRRE